MNQCHRDTYLCNDVVKPMPSLEELLLESPESNLSQYNTAYKDYFLNVFGSCASHILITRSRSTPAPKIYKEIAPLLKSIRNPIYINKATDPQYPLTKIFFK